jgi:hypothetical protein
LHSAAARRSPIRAEQVRAAQRRDACGTRKGSRPWGLAGARGHARAGAPRRAPSRSPTITAPARSTFYRETRTPLRTEDLSELENAGRRCGVCRSGRGWRRFELVRPTGREPVVLCGNCRARFGDDPPVGRKPAPPLKPVPATPESLAPSRRRSGAWDRPTPGSPAGGAAQAAGSFSTALAARAAGINSHRALAGYRSAAARSDESASAGRPESPPSDVAAAMDRLEARTSNLRIVRERAAGRLTGRRRAIAG